MILLAGLGSFISSWSWLANICTSYGLIIPGSYLIKKLMNGVMYFDFREETLDGQ